ncbi:HNH endonuclease [Rahnella aquatilis]|jgi:hypothetical protein|uniref:HNH endonuclease n=1 Tax=Rahnella sp. NRRL B-41462 TaxID=1610579 RepID=UPI000DD3B8D0|nr:HNH endonuclease signature motif containing protein [Rahnella sp. NRRL B-41462]QBJ10362.1 HNH endonuclease [Rahnella aquatilis]
MTDSRSAIPEDVKREVRKQCNFGCAVCGMPFFQYDHIEEYSEVKEHTADNLVLLCPNHHSAKTTGKLSKDRIIEAKKEPFNVENSTTSQYKIEKSKKINVKLGSNTITGWDPHENERYLAIWINEKEFFTIYSENDWYSVSLILTDEIGTILLKIDRGELVVSTDSWDYEWVGENIKIREKVGKIILDLNISDVHVEISRGMFIDQNKDGFIIKDNNMIAIYDGKDKGHTYQGNQTNASEVGGFALLNTKLHPEVAPPRGFSFRSRP